MNKKVLFGVFGLAGSMFAAENVSTFNPYVAVKGGYSILSKKDGAKYKNGFAGAAEFGVSYDAFRLGLEVSYKQNTVKDIEAGKAAANAGLVKDAKFNTLAAMINVYYDYALTEECSLYAGLGLGAAKVSAKKDGVEFGKTVFAWQLMAGVAYDINENWTVEAGYRLFNTSKFGGAKKDKKIKAPFANSIELGLRYNF